MIKILIDTCVWLDIAKTSKGDKILELLLEFLDRGEVSLITPDLILEEFKRNKDRVINDAGKSLSSQFKKIKEMVYEHGTDELKDIVINQLNDIDHKIPTLSENAFYSIQTIEELLNNSEKIKITDAIKLRATQRAIDKKAPFHLSKNSIGDAIIIESFIEHKDNSLSKSDKLMFVTHNKTDFSLKNGNQKLPHEDFNDLFSNNESQYFISLPEALNSINPEIVAELEFENNWNLQPRSFSEIIEAENELIEKLWYNRHQLRLQSIESGNVKIVDREEYDNIYSSSTIVKDIWEGALQSAKKVELKYGIENLYFDDYEWGMLNGKLSALRWATGDEWDNLDT